MKFKSLLPALLLLLAGCQNNWDRLPVSVQGYVEEIGAFGEYVPSFSASFLELSGIEYGDLLQVRIGSNKTFDAPYVYAYSDAGSMSPNVCNYNREGEQFGIGLTNGNLSEHLVANVGDKITLTLKEKSAVKLCNLVHTYVREDYPSDEAFANFRKAPKLRLLYRSSSPINYGKNKVRYAYADSLCRKAGIKTIIDMADSDEKVQEYLAFTLHEGSYVREIQDNIIGLGVTADYIGSAFLEQTARAVREMLGRPGPYLIHCNEGKDRTGFFLLLLESLCGATLQELEDDYMQTYKNMYALEKGSEAYDAIWEKNGYRMVYHFAHPECWQGLLRADWSGISLEGTDLSAAARTYLLETGLTDVEIDSLKNLLSE